MSFSPDHLERYFRALGQPPGEIRTAGNAIVKESLGRLKNQGENIEEEDGSVSRVVTIFSPEAQRIRRIKSTGLVRYGDFTLMKGDPTRPRLLIAGFQLDEHMQFQEYLTGLRLGAVPNDTRSLLALSGMNPVALRISASEIRSARKVSPYMFDQVLKNNPYVGVKI